MTTILVVDDNDDIRDLIMRRLQERGYSVLAARNGIEAVVSAATCKPSLILMDVNMPELDGFEATLQIRESGDANRIPVIALTAYALPGDEERAIAAGCDAFNPKPMDFEHLFEQITNLLGVAS